MIGDQGVEFSLAAVVIIDSACCRLTTDAHMHVHIDVINPPTHILTQFSLFVTRCSVTTIGKTLSKNALTIKLLL